MSSKTPLDRFARGTRQSHFRNWIYEVCPVGTGMRTFHAAGSKSDFWANLLISVRAALTSARLYAPEALPLLTAERSQLQ